MPQVRNRSEQGFVRNLNCSDEQFIIAVKNSHCIAEVLRNLNILRMRGSQYDSVKFKIEKLNLDISHWNPHLASRKNLRPKRDLTELLIENSPFDLCRTSRLIKEGILTNNCYECGLLPEWNNKTLSLQVDHINGKNFDHRKENLRLLCPNCHSQTKTFGGRNRKTRTTSRTCIMCTKYTWSTNKLCRNCYSNRPNKTKIDWPSVSELIHLIESSSVLAASRSLGVSDAAIYKHLNSSGYTVKNKKVYPISTP